MTAHMESKSQKIVTVFRSRLKEGQQEVYAQYAPEIYALAKASPGFLSAKTFTANDGERLTVVEFDNMENHLQWSHHHKHIEAKKRGIAEFYKEYHISVCQLLYERNFEQKP
jgi:heme-degrading monooxygenase HmoA